MTVNEYITEVMIKLTRRGEFESIEEIEVFFADSLQKVAILQKKECLKLALEATSPTGEIKS